MKVTKEVKIAITAIIAIAILFFGLNFLKGHLVFSDDNTYKIMFNDVEGLSASSPVYADGYKVGVVRDIEYDYESHKGVTVIVDLDDQLRIPKNTTAEVVSDLMGNVKVNLLLANNPRERIEPGGTIQGSVNDGIMGKAKNMLPAIEKMLPKIDSILIAVNTLLTDPALASSLHNIDGMTADLRQTTIHLKDMMSQIHTQVPGMLAKTNHVLNGAATTLDNTSKITTDIAQIDIARTMAEVDQVIANVNAFTAKLNNNEGSFGKFMNDPAMFDNMSHLLMSTDSLVTDLKAHPKRYVHFSLFGSRTK